MVGLCGIIGNHHGDIEALAHAISYRGHEQWCRYATDEVSIAYVDHPQLFTEQPVQVDENTIMWIWGTILGHEHRGTYHAKPDSVSGPAFVASLYRAHGMSFVVGLNSEFVGMLYDREDTSLTFFTDRLGSRPIYYTRCGDGSIVFSPLIQTLDIHPGVELAFDRSLLSEFLQYHRTLGIFTPVAGVFKLPPGSVVTMSASGSILEQWTYWWPNPSPQPMSFDETVNRFAETIRAAVTDRIQSGPSGLFLSGGMDSRAVLAALDTDVVAFHFNEQQAGNLEAELAERAAKKAGVTYHFLKRELDHYPNVLEQTGPITNFNGHFRVANHIGFEETIADRVTHVFNGQYSDTLIGPTYVPLEGNRPRAIREPAAYVNAFDAGEMGGHAKEIPFVRELPAGREVLCEHIAVSPHAIESHGVSYPTWDSLVQFGMIYPLTNVRSYIWYETQVHCFPTAYPFLDNRMVDLVLSSPVQHRYDRDLMAAVVQKLNPALATVANITHHPLLYYILHTPLDDVGDNFLRGIGLREGAVTMTRPNSHLRPLSGFPHTAGLIRAHPFIHELINDQWETIEATDFIDENKLLDTYDRHLAGENYTDRLFGIASVLQSGIDTRHTPNSPRREE